MKYITSLVWAALMPLAQAQLYVAWDFGSAVIDAKLISVGVNYPAGLALSSDGQNSARGSGAVLKVFMIGLCAKRIGFHA